MFALSVWSGYVRPVTAVRAKYVPNNFRALWTIHIGLYGSFGSSMVEVSDQRGIVVRIVSREPKAGLAVTVELATVIADFTAASTQFFEVVSNQVERGPCQYRDWNGY